jgi:heme exporter protein C
MMTARPHIPRAGRWPLFGWLAVLFLIGSQVEGILTSPPDRDMGDLEKILYVHLPAAFMTFLAFFLVLVFSLKYLWKGREEVDPHRRAQWSAAVGILGAINVPIVYMSVSRSPS